MRRETRRQTGGRNIASRFSHSVFAIQIHEIYRELHAECVDRLTRKYPQPSSADKWSRPNRPFRRVAPWSATSTLPARTAWRVRFDIFSRRSGVVRRPRIVPLLARRRIHCAIPVIVAVHHSMVLVSWPLQKLKSYRSSVVAQSSCFERASRPACWEQQPR